MTTMTGKEVRSKHIATLRKGEVKKVCRGREEAREGMVGLSLSRRMMT
jgi:hypothetical protein